MRKLAILTPTTFTLAAAVFVAADLAIAPPAFAAQEAVVFDSADVAGLGFRSIGPPRGGRSTAVAGITEQPLTYFMGATGGGVWRTDDAGLNWRNISDGYIGTGAIGSIDVADSDANVIYVGTGSSCIRGNISKGIGIYRSTNGGDSWTPHRAPELGPDRRHQSPPERRRHRLRGGARRPVRPQPGARSVPDDGRRRHVGPRSRDLRLHGRRGPRDQPVESAHRLRLGVAGRAQALDRDLGFGGVRRLPVDRWRGHVGPARGRAPHRPRRQVRRHRLPRQPRPRVGAHRGVRRSRRRLPLRGRRRHVAAGEQRPRTPAAGVVLHAHLRGPGGREHGLRPQRGLQQVGSTGA